MKQKLAPIPLSLYPIEEPYKPSYSELMAELEVYKKRVQIEKEEKRKRREEAKKTKVLVPDLYHGFGIFLCLLVFIFS